MAYKPPTPPTILDDLEYFGMRDGRKVWRTERGDRLYTWDSQHGEVEVFNRRGRHLGAVHAQTGVFVKEPSKTKGLNV